MLIIISKYKDNESKYEILSLKIALSGNNFHFIEKNAWRFKCYVLSLLDKL